MKKSKNSVRYIAVLAYINSDWDNIDYAIIRIDERYKLSLKRKLEFLSSDEDFLYSSWIDNNISFHDGYIDFPIDDNRSWIELTEDEYKKAKPTNILLSDTKSIRIETSGFVSFIGEVLKDGKEVWTDRISIDEILKETIPIKTFT